MLLNRGRSRWTSLEHIAKQHNVTATTISNWDKKYKDVTVSLQHSTPTVKTIARNNHTGGFTIQSINVRLTNDTDADLAPVDINKIATLASTIC